MSAYGGPERLPTATADRIAVLAGLMSDQPDYAKQSAKVWPQHRRWKEAERMMPLWLNEGPNGSSGPESLRSTY